MSNLEQSQHLTEANAAAPHWQQEHTWADQAEDSINHAANKAADALHGQSTTHHNRRQSSSQQFSKQAGSNYEAQQANSNYDELNGDLNNEQEQGIGAKAKQVLRDATEKVGVAMHLNQSKESE